MGEPTGVAADTSQIIAWASGPVGVLTGLLISLYVKDQTRKVVKEEFHDLIRAALSEFQTQFHDTMSGTYRRTAECLIIERLTDQRITSLEQRMDAIVGVGMSAIKRARDTCVACSGSLHEG